MKVSVIKIIYKNGESVEVHCTKFKGKSTEGEISHLEWEVLEGQPSPIHIGIKDISSIWQIREYETEVIL